MRTVYSVPLFRHVALAAGSTTLYTTPPGFVVVLRDLIFLSAGSSGEVFIEDPDVGLGWEHYLSSTAFEAFHWQGRQVYDAGMQLGCYVNSGTWNVRASGYKLPA